MTYFILGALSGICVMYVLHIYTQHKLGLAYITEEMEQEIDEAVEAKICGIVFYESTLDTWVLEVTGEEKTIKTMGKYILGVDYDKSA